MYYLYIWQVLTLLTTILNRITPELCTHFCSCGGILLNEINADSKNPAKRGVGGQPGLVKEFVPLTTSACRFSPTFYWGSYRLVFEGH